MEFLSHFLRPRGTLHPEQVAELTDLQASTEKSADTLANYLEDITKNRDDPFEDFARRARAARWRRP